MEKAAKDMEEARLRNEMFRVQRELKKRINKNT